MYLLCDTLEIALNTEQPSEYPVNMAKHLSMDLQTKSRWWTVTLRQLVEPPHSFESNVKLKNIKFEATILDKDRRY